MEIGTDLILVQGKEDREMLFDSKKEKERVIDSDDGRDWLTLSLT